MVHRGRRAFLAAVGSSGVLAAFPAAARALRESFDMDVPVAPCPVTVHGAALLVYELHLTNFSPDRLRLTRLRVIERESGAPLAELHGGALAARAAQIGVRAADTLAIAPGGRAVIYIEVESPAGAERARERTPAAGRPRLRERPPPRASGVLIHRLDYAVEGSAERFTIEGGETEIGEPAVVLGPPLADGPWAAVYNHEWPRGHRRVIYTIDGRARIPGRFAIDWVKVDDEGRIARGDPDGPANHLGYGAPVIAVADAVVAAVRDGVPESETVSGNPKHPLADASGNFVALDVGQGRFVFYEHLKPGSVAVRAGDAVKRGDALAELGFTGDSTGPHLHFHVADAPSPPGGEGMPFAIDRFELLGRYEDIAALGRERWRERPATLAAERVNERPGPIDVIALP
jgi:murein DD-endopeptidase MepM/ murein hydrolase activator NlpD